MICAKPRFPPCLHGRAAVFRDFDTDGSKKITSDEFLAFFAKAVKSASNAEFDIMISEMLPSTE